MNYRTSMAREMEYFYLDPHLEPVRFHILHPRYIYIVWLYSGCSNLIAPKSVFTVVLRHPRGILSFAKLYQTWNK